MIKPERTAILLTIVFFIVWFIAIVHLNTRKKILIGNWTFETSGPHYGASLHIYGKNKWQNFFYGPYDKETKKTMSGSYNISMFGKYIIKGKTLSSESSDGWPAGRNWKGEIVHNKTLIISFDEQSEKLFYNRKY